MHYDGDDPAALRSRAAERMHSRVEDMRFVSPAVPSHPLCCKVADALMAFSLQHRPLLMERLFFIDARHVDRGAIAHAA